VENESKAKHGGGEEVAATTVIAMTTAIALFSLVHLHPCLRRVGRRGRGVSHGNDKEEKQGGRPSHIVVLALPTLPPPSGRDVISPARIVANVLNDTFIGGEEEGAAMVVAESNGTTTTTTMLV
jgi:hypothetical protein